MGNYADQHHNKESYRYSQLEFQDDVNDCLKSLVDFVEGGLSS